MRIKIIDNFNEEIILLHNDLMILKGYKNKLIKLILLKLVIINNKKIIF